MTSLIIYDDIVQIMERGQLTVPVAVRKKLNLTKGAKLWFRITERNEIILETLATKTSSNIQQFLKKYANDRTIYWFKEDDKRLKINRNKSIERLKNIYDEGSS